METEDNTYRNYKSKGRNFFFWEERATTEAEGTILVEIANLREERKKQFPWEERAATEGERKTIPI